MILLLKNTVWLHAHACSPLGAPNPVCVTCMSHTTVTDCLVACSLKPCHWCCCAASAVDGATQRSPGIHRSAALAATGPNGHYHSICTTHKVQLVGVPTVPESLDKPCPPAACVTYSPCFTTFGQLAIPSCLHEDLEKFLTVLFFDPVAA